MFREYGLAESKLVKKNKRKRKQEAGSAGRSGFGINADESVPEFDDKCVLCFFVHSRACVQENRLIG